MPNRVAGISILKKKRARRPLCHRLDEASAYSHQCVGDQYYGDDREQIAERYAPGKFASHYGQIGKRAADRAVDQARLAAAAFSDDVAVLRTGLIPRPAALR
jgi:hypothetical protein